MDDHGLEEPNPFHGEIEEIKDEIDKRFKRFKNFDIVTEIPFDHEFKDKKYKNKHSVFGISSSSSSSLTEKLQRERRILETNLPNSIFVRAYTKRTDLMRAVIIGPPNTPYYHCIFFFDILFPSNYPTAPPKLIYRSQGLDLKNPNLRPDGKVCLNLLENGEGWDPTQSNLLQVLVSIHRQIWISKSYLEESKEQKYNRDTLMLTSEAIVRTLESPPRHFEDFVTRHFRQRAHAILMNYRKHTNESEGMTRLFIKLLRALESTGAYCKHHLSPEILEKESEGQRSRNNGFFSRVLTKVKNLADWLA